jgi:hypothetical protein
VLARVKPMAESKPDEIPSAVVLVDTSASRALGFKDELRLVESFVKALAAGAGARTPLAVACFDQAVQVVYDGPAGSFGEGELKKMRERRALGASDLQRALLWAAERAGKASSSASCSSARRSHRGRGRRRRARGRGVKLKAAASSALARSRGRIRDDALLRRSDRRVPRTAWWRTQARVRRAARKAPEATRTNWR